MIKIAIPIYRTVLSEYERISLRQVHYVLAKYPIIIIKPQSLDLSPLMEAFPGIQFESFNDAYFRDISGYNRLMLSSEFYERFTDSEYLLVYQLDAYVFRDELTEWCKKGYDYIGAPWLVRPVYRFPLFRLASGLKSHYCRLFSVPNGQMTHYKVGNGGFSLRKVASHLRATRQLDETIQQYLSFKKNHLFHEDVFFAVEVNRHGLGFTYPDYQEALRFAFDKYPALCFKLNNQQLPFGCHSWYKRKMKRFWFPIIFHSNHPISPK